MYKISLGVFCLVLAIIFGNAMVVTGSGDADEMCIPMGTIVLEPLQGVEAKRTPVDFHHPTHFGFSCQTCHHKWIEMDKPISGCSTSGCHDVAESPKPSETGAVDKEMAARYPEYADVLFNINDRIYDLVDIFSKGFYVHPDFYGSSSIKNVLPVLVDDLTYDGLPIPKGDEAMLAWLEIMKGALSQEEVKQTKKNLLDYCEMDTMAMVKNWEVLVDTVGR